jgi:hypothetical protein
MAKTQSLCDLDLKIYLMTSVAKAGVFIEYKEQHNKNRGYDNAGD